MNKIRFANLIFILIGICTLLALDDSSVFAWTGKVIDKETRKPVEGVVIVRSWNREWETPAGTVPSLVTINEGLSDINGDFSVSILKRMSHIGLPLFAPIEENKSIVYKPGYKLLLLNDKPELIELEKIPAIYILRFEEAQKAKSNSYDLDFYKTKILKREVEEEEKYIKKLTKYVPGVFYTGLSSPHDIAIDNEGNVYVADGHLAIKFSTEGKAIGNFGTEFNELVDSVATDQNGILCIYNERKMYCDPQGIKGISIRGLYGKGIRFVVKHENIYIIKGHTFYTYGLADEKLTVRDNNNPTSDNDNIFTDISVGPTGTIVLAYSSYNPNWDKSINGYCYSNKLILLYKDGEKHVEYIFNTCSRIRSVIQTKSGFVVADTDTIYILNNDLNLIYKEELRGTELGTVDIDRIVLDNNENFLYLLDRRYGRILKYNLIAKELAKPMVAP